MVSIQGFVIETIRQDKANKESLQYLYNSMLYRSALKGFLGPDSI